MCVCTVCQAVSLAHYFQRGYRNGMQVRAAVILLIYNKSLRLVPSSLEDKKDDKDADAKDEEKKKWGLTPAEKLRNQGRTGPFQRALMLMLPKDTTKVDMKGSIGQIMNLITADTERFAFLMPYINLTWSAPFTLIVAFIYIGCYVSFWGLLGGLSVMLLSCVVSAKVQKIVQALTKEVMKVKDERLKIQTELLGAVKMVKIYAWEETVAERVREIREREL